MSAAFDKLAPAYDETWTRTPSGRSQRDVVWATLDRLFLPGQHVLDLGCGTGEDALHLMVSAIRVTAIDASPRMVDEARLRGVEARELAIEQLGTIRSVFDGAISNFGALNCVADIGQAARELARVVPPGGYVVVCVIGRFCLWETLYYVVRGNLAKATRRWSGRSASSSLGITVFYPAVRRLARLFRPEFRLVSWNGVGVLVPPSYVKGCSPRLIRRLSSLDGRIAGLPFFRSLADHRLLVFKRI